MSQTKTLQVPAIVTDIDGVLIRGKIPIPGSQEAIKKIRQPLKNIHPKYSHLDETNSLPVYCLTNSGGVLEFEKANSLNHTLGIDENSYEALTKDCVFVNFSALRTLMDQYSDKLVLISGVNDIKKIAEDSNLKRFITINEFISIWPDICPKSQKWTEKEKFEFKEEVKERLNWTDNDLKDLPQFSVIFLLNDVNRWDEKLQVILDYLSTEDGRIAKKFPEKITKTIKVYAPNDDFQFAEQFKLPRLAHGFFNDCLKLLSKKIYNYDLDIEVYGKPMQIAFNNVKERILKNSKLEISNYYMIGDNPSSDIVGGNNMDWITILVRSGVWKGSELTKKNAPDYIVNNFQEACDLIFELEGLN